MYSGILLVNQCWVVTSPKGLMMNEKTCSNNSNQSSGSSSICPISSIKKVRRLCRDYIQVLASMYVCFSKHRSIVGSSFPGYLPLQATRYQAHYFFFLSLGRSSKLIPWNLRSEYPVCPTDLPRRSFASASLFRKEFARLSSESASEAVKFQEKWQLLR